MSAAFPLWTNAVYGGEQSGVASSSSSVALTDILPCSCLPDETWTDVLIANYMIDMAWLLETAPALKTLSGHLVVLSGEKSTAMVDVKWAPSGESVSYTPKSALLDKVNPILHATRSAGVPRDRVVVIEPPLPIPYGTHHSKMILAVNKRGLRVVITTANFIHADWHNKTQGCYVQDFPRLGEPRAAPSTPRGDEFRDYLRNYLRRSGVAPCDGNHNNGYFFKKPSFLNDFDFSEAKVRLVGSVPGSHSGSVVTTYGQNRLRHLLSSQPPPPREGGSNNSVVLTWQYSSQGSLNDAFLNSLQTSMASPGDVVRDVQVVYPTEEEVRSSLEGWRAGLSLPLQVRNCHPFINERLHKWGRSGDAAPASTAPVIDVDAEEEDDRADLLFQHSDPVHRRAMPHLKSYASMDVERTHLRWFLLTSANMSQAAWGSRTAGGDTKLFIRSYELGVLYDATSSVRHSWFTATPSRPIALPTAENCAHLVAVPVGQRGGCCMYLPYDIRSPTPYASTALLRASNMTNDLGQPTAPRVSAQDVPWVTDMPHRGRDCLGLDIAAAVEDYTHYGPASWAAEVRRHDGAGPPIGTKRLRD